ncbi:MAG: hypothetical protein COZ56_16700 [Armatimonadetes bacterium CG_4_8_14_3_um_filter_58_9]|nr:MAG: hypothetical protein COZ56_16700 [Armatimonadetes bacterium CG_4_8_14_3_um_filter_58_9]
MSVCSTEVVPMPLELDAVLNGEPHPDDAWLRRLGIGPVDLSVVIVGTDESEYLRECLTSIYSQEYGFNLEVIVVDNGSVDGTLKMMDEEFQQVRCIRNDTRYPRSRNNNIGYQAAEGKYVLFLDPDTRVLPGAFESMMGFLDQNPEAGMCGCRLIDVDGSVQMSSRTWQTPLTVLLRRTRLGACPLFRPVVDRHLMADWDHNSVREVDWIQGAAMMVRREAVADVGLMDDVLLRYSEDIDWCFRFWKLGWKVFYVPGGSVIHAYRRTSNRPLVSLKDGVNHTLWMHLRGFLRTYNRQALFPFEKRCIDILGATAGILLLSPLMVLTALLIKLDSPGPVFFVQERVGRDGRRFFMYKFRSMRQGAEDLLSALQHLNEATGPVFKMREDPRLTGIGRHLRRWSLDELPQLFNVLQGTMSLIGPRPLPSLQVDFGNARSLRRLRATPGLSGLWQVSGRSEIDFSRWVDLDIRYIAQQSVEQEILILLSTFPAVVRGKGAY